jgi:hypothetical protein
MNNGNPQRSRPVFVDMIPPTRFHSGVEEMPGKGLDISVHEKDHGALKLRVFHNFKLT